MRLIQLGDDYKPLIHDIVKTCTILLVIEVIQFMRKGQPLFDNVFIRQTLYNLAGICVFYMLVDPVIGATGDACCSLRKMLKL